MVGLALAIFIALFGWGERYFGWHDPAGKVQLALFTSFVLGALCGYKSNPGALLLSRQETVRRASRRRLRKRPT